MLRNGQRLLRLINQILDLAKLQAGQLALDRRPHDLVAVAREATLAFAPLAERQAVALRFAAAPGSLVLPLDAGQVEKVLLNLLSNALKFTAPGGAVDVEVRADGDGAALAVRDTGVGIAADELPRVFDRFHQADTSATAGTRARLSGWRSARELVELHGGTIGVESAPGVGSVFEVRLPGPAVPGDGASVPALAVANLADTLGGSDDAPQADGAAPPTTRTARRRSSSTTIRTCGRTSGRCSRRRTG
jgi:signal transduction histidine kinase